MTLYSYNYAISFGYRITKVKGGGKILSATALLKKNIKDGSTILGKFDSLIEPVHEKTNNLHTRKQRRRSASQAPLFSLHG